MSTSNTSAKSKKTKLIPLPKQLIEVINKIHSKSKTSLTESELTESEQLERQKITEEYKNLLDGTLYKQFTEEREAKERAAIEAREELRAAMEAERLETARRLETANRLEAARRFEDAIQRKRERQIEIIESKNNATRRQTAFLSGNTPSNNVAYSHYNWVNGKGWGHNG